MKLYNTPSKQLEDIVQDGDHLTIYTCGPTVYDYPHVGNWFTFLRYDTLVRALRSQNYSVKWVMNITDVGHLVSDADEGEDKLEKGAKREGKTAWDVAGFYGDYFVNGLRGLNFSTVDVLPKATDHIAEQISLIQTLEEKGHTYKIDDGMYFDTSTFPDYDALDGNSLNDDQYSRVELNLQKRNSSDFAVWKFSPIEEQRDMEWDSPWGMGFPGWHLECSAMAMKYLGETLDIHAGGIDHIPVHHKNEIAQSEAATGRSFVRHWLHANHITVNGQKISKSLGNGITLEEIEAEGYELMVLRLHALESHYRTQSKFSWDGMEAARTRLNGYRALAALRYQDNGSQDASSTDELIHYLTEQVAAQLTAAINDDLNTPELLRVVSEVENRLDQGIPTDVASSLESVLGMIDDLTGLELLKVADITEDQKELLKLRQQAREAREWQKSDEIRDQLLTQGIAIRDTTYGQLWHWS